MHATWIPNRFRFPNRWVTGYEYRYRYYQISTTLTGMIGYPRFWYGGMLQAGAAGRFLGYGGMRQPVRLFRYVFTLSFTRIVACV